MGHVAQDLQYHWPEEPKPAPLPKLKSIELYRQDGTLFDTIQVRSELPAPEVIVYGVAGTSFERVFLPRKGKYVETKGFIHVGG